MGAAWGRLGTRRPSTSSPAPSPTPPTAPRSPPATPRPCSAWPEPHRRTSSRSAWRQRLPDMTLQPSGQTVTETLGRLRLIFHPPPPAQLDQIRAAGTDEAGNRLTVQTAADGGNPLRCCLRESVPG